MVQRLSDSSHCLPVHQHISLLYSQAYDVLAAVFSESDEFVKRMAIRLSRNYVTSLLKLAKKSRLRISPTIKKSICPRCNLVLIGGNTCSMVIRKRLIIKSCHHCFFKTVLRLGVDIFVPRRLDAYSEVK
ncbi:unnamed protein product [Protopolystoma xenopodis]|uniref:Uncharacterized protein n=1 Tax=Protopolystoma xenopodis TaxID=117903 RepID=A0A448XRM3_9PLAT|nr:unnamed protein product [Protopolystoma xenopodis]